MQNQVPPYSEHYETIISLVTYLALCKRHSESYNKVIDNATAGWLAKYLGLEKNEVQFVLDNYKGLFRKTINEYKDQSRYSLLLRYAQRLYVKGEPEDASEPLSNEELFFLLDFINNKVREEREEKHYAETSRNQKIAMAETSRNQKIAMYIAALSALIAAVATILAAFLT